MDNLQWRRRARIVAYVDLILTSMALLMVILATIGVGVFTAVVNNPEFLNKQANGTDSDSDSSPEEIDPAVKEVLAMSTWVLWVVVALAAVFTFIQLWASIKLLNGTDVGREFHEALKRAAIWRNVTIVFLVFSVCSYLFTGSYVSLALSILIRGIFLYIVHKFMLEVNYHLTTATMSGPTVVTVKQ